jgi:hypothetical protein
MNSLMTQPTTFCVFIVAKPEPIFASSRDYGFDFDEEEIGRELLTPLSASFSTQPVPEIEADEFDQTFHYFLS